MNKNPGLAHLPPIQCSIGHTCIPEDVRNKFNGGGGDFYSIKNTLCGYCNWSVETKWGDEVKRWNILDDSGKEQEENLVSPDIPGFTHILT